MVLNIKQKSKKVILIRLIDKIVNWRLVNKLKVEFENQTFKRINERAIEYAFLFKHLNEISKKKILDIGSGKTSLPHMMSNCGYIVTAIDNVQDYWISKVFNRHYYIIDDDITDTNLKENYDIITCISVLEHIPNYNGAIKNMYSLLKSGGYLILTFPYNEIKYIKNVYELTNAGYGKDFPYICQIFSRKQVDNWIHQNGGIIEDQEYWQIWDGEFWTIGNQLIPPNRVNKNEKHQLTCLLIRKT